jgi:hypothetical protein
MAEMKERLEQKTEGIVDLEELKRVEVPPGVETWMRKVEQASTKQAGETGIATPILVGQTSPKVVVPITRQGFAIGFRKKISEAGRWLSAFIFRLIKIKKSEVEFKEE